MGVIRFAKKYFGLKGNIADPLKVRKAVRLSYSHAAVTPGGKHPFPVGRWFAESIGYPKNILDSLPGFVSESFTGVSNVPIFADIPRGATVLDIGCGAGLDSLVVASKARKVIGIDFSNEMLKKAKEGSIKASQYNTDFCCAAAEDLPFPDKFFDVILVNGIFNLNPFRREIFREMSRVIKSGGSVYAAELILKKPQIAKKLCDLNDWFS